MLTLRNNKQVPNVDVLDLISMCQLAVGTVNGSLTQRRTLIGIVSWLRKHYPHGLDHEYANEIVEKWLSSDIIDSTPTLDKQQHACGALDCFEYCNSDCPNEVRKDCDEENDMAMLNRAIDDCLKGRV